MVDKSSWSGNSWSSWLSHTSDSSLPSWDLPVVFIHPVLNMHANRWLSTA
jgi:hypothetical protein